MLPTCKEVSEQLSENLDQPVKGFRWFKLKLHLLMCVYCRRYGKQLELSTKTVNLVDSKTEPSDALKEKALENFRKCQCDKK